jgi:outer membrane receptor protein involved in Fe transport
LLGAASAAAITAGAWAANFNVPAGDLEAALDAYTQQSGIALAVPSEAIRGVRTDGVKGNLSPDAALSRILKGTGFIESRDRSGAIGIMKGAMLGETNFELAQATASPRAAVETVTVTSSKLGGADVQSIPIAITALSQEQLTATQTAGGPDLVKQVPNLTFTKTNFTGYSIQIRGIGTQAISVTTDPAVAVAFNDMPFIRNHFFEQEFYDVSQVEVLRGPQGTLYGRNATAGVVNLTSARPTDQFEAMASGELGNYHERRFEGMINLPIVDDRLDIRLAGEWTKRQGYSFNETTNERIDGRDLWSGRLSIGWKPSENLQAYLIWEHFSESDDRIRSSKQLCKKAPIPTEVGGQPVGPAGGIFSQNVNGLSQGCLPASFYSPDAYQVPNGYSLPYVLGLNADVSLWDGVTDPYSDVKQSRNLRVIQSQLDPTYKAKNDIVELNADYRVTPELTLTSQTGFNHDFLYSIQDYNRFNTAPGIFYPAPDFGGPIYDSQGNVIGVSAGGNERGQVSPDGVFCDPQLGCSNRLVAEDQSVEHAWQLSQEFRLTSNFSGPLNFSFGGNYLHYETAENYYVFINALTLYASIGPVENFRIKAPWIPGVSDNHECLQRGGGGVGAGGYVYPDPNAGGGGVSRCSYIDPNPLTSLNDEGHNYFLSQNPYVLNSYAGFGEVYYNILKDVKLTGGLRWTEDRKHFTLIPSQVITAGYGYPIAGAVDQQWDELTGRSAINWTPKLDFTDQSLFYASFAHGYKAGGANPPGTITLQGGDFQAVHPLTFKPEFIDAFELGTKNTLLDGALMLNASAFYYNYENYQISEIVDRTSVNLNFDAHVKGAELEATWEPVPGLRFNFAGGYEDARLAKGSKAVDLMDRTAGNPDWVVVRPDLTEASNCILPVDVVQFTGAGSPGPGNASWCDVAYIQHNDPITGAGYTALDPTIERYSQLNGQYLTGYTGFNPLTAPNNGVGFYKDLSHNEMPNAPPYTVSAGAQYSMPISSDWAATLRTDFYWQSNSYWRVFNDLDYDKLHGYTNLNLTLILTSQAGWQVMLFDKNVFNTTAITGAFLNSDDTGLTTNVFLTDPKLIGIRVTKNW